MDAWKDLSPSPNRRQQDLSCRSQAKTEAELATTGLSSHAPGRREGQELPSQLMLSPHPGACGGSLALSVHRPPEMVAWAAHGNTPQGWTGKTATRQSSSLAGKVALNGHL